MSAIHLNTTAGSDRRQMAIADMLRSRDFISVEELAAHFAVATQTIRRDLVALCDQGVARRRHGGIESLARSGNDMIRAGSGDDRIEAGEGDDVIDAGSGDDIVLGGAGNDIIDGGSGADRLEGGAGDDILTGGSGHDVFVFAAGFGMDVITDFKTTGSSSDVLEFDVDLFADFDDAMDAASQVGADTVFTIDADTSVTLKGVQLTSLAVDDFRFV
ncbi:MAG TPA: DeoR family transcriptional regulator [Bosea sp. (in: a-proteobacteria)]|uniref:DeoR family transcriptional regulator n=1 Tax=Bosea sp. (in: a-proteobacteria) TaxID=1871050 RepID=UPI002DDD3B72|nr:DeoR family transcriptional regulator [Bosea sp. (in: a-proteobacteria)]HEV2556162.1 DeoR family transcriptional regulator [Bosea sp. (in: a-proteobacteria)]